MILFRDGTNALLWLEKQTYLSYLFTLLFAVQMKLIVEPTLTVWDLGSSTVTSIGLDGDARETTNDLFKYVTFRRSNQNSTYQHVTQWKMRALSQFVLNHFHVLKHGYKYS